MRILKIAVGTTIIIGSLGVGFFLIESRAPIDDAVQNPERSFSENPLATTIFSTNNPAENPVSLRATGKSSENATEKISKKIAEELIAQNPGGPSLTNGIPSITALDPEKLIEEATAAGLASFDYDSFKPEANIKALTIISVSDKQTLETYFTEFNAALENGRMKLPSELDGSSLAAFVTASHAISETVEKLSRIKTPAGVAVWHAEEIAVLTAQKNIFEAIVGANIDPIRALAAIQAFPASQTELAKLSELFTDFIIKENLSI